MGNLKSVENACCLLGQKVKITDNRKVIASASAIIFPGVGHFAKAVKELQNRQIFKTLKEKIKTGVPFLGICLGMQILFEESEEASGIKGLGIIKGKVKKFKLKNLCVPHMGWNQVKIKNQKLKIKNKGILKDIRDGSYFYFVHSYYCAPENKNVILATTNYGVEFVSVLHKDNIWAVQFHAEKSQKVGLKLLYNFFKLC